jgi:hypothetical protein
VIPRPQSAKADFVYFQRRIHSLLGGRTALILFDDTIRRITAPHRTAPHRTAPHRTAPHRASPTAPHIAAPGIASPHRKQVRRLHPLPRSLCDRVRA